MRKAQELAYPDSCWNKAEPQENMFILLGRDQSAAATIRFWIMRRIELGKNRRLDKQIVDAAALADSIEADLKRAAR